MSERRFDIIFNGCSDNIAISDVKNNIMQLFKLDEQQIEQIFSGSNVIIKKNVDRQSAAQYQAALNNAGAKIQLALHKPEAVNSNTANPDTSNHNTAVSNTTALNTQQSVEPTKVNKPNKTEQQSTLTINTSHIQLEERNTVSGENPFAAQNSNPFIADETSEPKYPSNEHIVLDSKLSLAEQRGDLLKQDEKCVYLEVNVDTSKLSLVDISD